MEKRPLLLVEDSDADAAALERIARRLPLPMPVVRVHDGESALDSPEPGEQLEAAARALQAFWLTAARLPGDGGAA